MSEHVFDLTRLRRNWASAEAKTVESVDRFAEVPSALDLPAAAHALMETLREQCCIAYPTHRAALDATLHDVQSALEALLVTDGPVVVPATGSSAERLNETLLRLEELMEAFEIVHRRG